MRRLSIAVIFVSVGSLAGPARADPGKPDVAVHPIVHHDFASVATDRAALLLVELPLQATGTVEVLDSQVWFTWPEGEFLAFSRPAGAPGALVDPQAGKREGPFFVTVPLFSSEYDLKFRITARTSRGERLVFDLDLPAHFEEALPYVPDPQPVAPPVDPAVKKKQQAFAQQVQGIWDALAQLPEAERAEVYGKLKSKALGE